LSSGGSLINLGDISKPATVLIERISDAVGGIAKPWQIKRVAKAEADADLIRAQTRIEISEAEERALVRMVREEGKKQENIESISSKAIPFLSEDAKPEEMESDWITQFFDRCRLVSDPQMQELWSQILAGEANSPGHFSKRTIDLVSTLDKKDAASFTKLCTFVFEFNDLNPIIYDIDSKIYTDQSINFLQLTHLDSIGLISFNNLTEFERTNFNKYTYIHYYDCPLCVEFPNDSGNRINIGKVLLTEMGKEIATICGSIASSEFLLFVIDQWIRSGLIISTPISSKSAWIKL